MFSIVFLRLCITWILNRAAYGYDRYRTVQITQHITHVRHVTLQSMLQWKFCHITQSVTRDITRFRHVILQIELHRSGCDITRLITGHITHIRQFILHVILHDVLHYNTPATIFQLMLLRPITHNKNYTKASCYSTYFMPYFSLYYSHVLPVHA